MFRICTYASKDEQTYGIKKSLTAYTEEDYALCLCRNIKQSCLSDFTNPQAILRSIARPPATYMKMPKGKRILIGGSYSLQLMQSILAWWKRLQLFALRTAKSLVSYRIRCQTWEPTRRWLASTSSCVWPRQSGLMNSSLVHQIALMTVSITRIPQRPRILRPHRVIATS